MPVSLVKLTAAATAEVDRLAAQATAYVWGWQDAGGPPPTERGWLADSAESHAFGEAYRSHAAAYAAERIGARHSIPTAYDLWSAGTDLNTGR